MYRPAPPPGAIAKAVFCPIYARYRTASCFGGFYLVIGTRRGVGRDTRWRVCSPPVLPLRFLRVLMFKSNQMVPKGKCDTGNRKSSLGAEGGSMKDDKRLAGPRRLRQPFWLGHGPDGTKWGAGVNL